MNTNGVFDESHVTCARDMALVGSALFAYPQFFDACQTQQYVIPATETVEEHVFQQHHHMLLDGNTDYYENAVGGKTGYTTEAENTLITMAQNGDKRLVCVALKTYEGHLYSDTRAMLDYAFSNFGRVSIEENDDCDGFELKDSAATVTLPANVSFDGLDRKFEEKGEGEAVVTYYYKDNPVGSCEVTLEEGVSDVSSSEESKEEDDAATVEEKESASLSVKLGIILAFVLGLLVIILFFTIRTIRKRRKRRRRYDSRRRRR